MNTRNTKRQLEYDFNLESSKKPKNDEKYIDDDMGIFWVYELDMDDDIINCNHKVLRHLIGPPIEIPDDKILIITNVCINGSRSNASNITISMDINKNNNPINMLSGICSDLNTNLNIRLCSKTKKVSFEAEGNLFNKVTLLGYFIDA